jgi:hypothetical protein
MIMPRNCVIMQNIMIETQDSLVSSKPKRSIIKQQQQQQPSVKYSLQIHKYTVMR